MPPVQSVAIGPTSFTIKHMAGIDTFATSTIPGSADTPAKIETFVNAWLATHITTCQVVVHVFTVSPLSYAILVLNLGLAIPANWWV